LSWLRALAPSVIALVCFAMRGWLRQEVSEFASSALWGLLLLVGNVGWGATLSYRLSPARRLGWGLEAALGMALSLWAGAIVAALYLVSPRYIAAWTFFGICALGITRVRRRGAAQVGLRAHRIAPHIILLFLIFAVFMALQYVGSLGNLRFNVFDDNMAYRGFARKLLETGSLYEPFSIRRIGSYGGQTMLLASVLAGVPDMRLHLLDNGICVLVAFGLIVGYRGGSRHAPFASVLLALVVLATLPHGPHNIGSEISGFIFFLAIFRVADDPDFCIEKPLANAIALALLAGAVCTLRQSNFAPAAFILGFIYLLRVLGHGRAERRRWLAEAGMVAGLTLFVLVPWMVLSYINAKTIFYPLLKGTTNPGFGMVGKVPFDEELRWFAINLGHVGPVHTIKYFLFAGFAITFARRNLAMHAQLLGCVCGYFLVLHFFQSWTDYESVARYHFSFTVAYAFTIALKAPETMVRGPRRTYREVIAATIVTVAIVLQVNDVKDLMHNVYNVWLGQAIDAYRHRNPDKDRVKDPLEILYQRIQDSVPPGERVVVMLDQTHLLDYARNDVLNLDEPGALSPPPGMPFHQGPEAVAQYFVSINARYIMYVLGESSPEYRYSMWRDRAALPPPTNNRGGLYRNMSGWYLDFFDNLQALEKSRKKLFQEGEIRVLDLATPSVPGAG
jgi:hypothetical protein